MAGRLFIIVGPPGSGKSLVINEIKKGDISNVDTMIITKQTNRRTRSEEGIEISPVQNKNKINLTNTESLRKFVKKNKVYYQWNNKKDELTLTGPMPFEEYEELTDVIEDSIENKHAIQYLFDEANELDNYYDIVYEQYTSRYGISTTDIYKALYREKYAFCIVNDIRSIREIKSIFGSLVVVIFLYRPMVDYKKIQKERGAYGADGNVDLLQSKRRADKTKVIIRRYIDNIEIFDHLILNTTTNKKDLIKQLSKIVMHHAFTEPVEFIVHEGLYE